MHPKTTLVSCLAAKFPGPRDGKESSRGCSYIKGDANPPCAIPLVDLSSTFNRKYSV